MGVDEPSVGVDGQSSGEPIRRVQKANQKKQKKGNAISSKAINGDDSEVLGNEGGKSGSLKPKELRRCI